MDQSSLPLPLTPHRRRHLVAVLLRGDLAAYDATPLFQAKVDRLVDELLHSCGRLVAPNAWDVLADQVIARYAHRLPEPRTGGPFSLMPGRAEGAAAAHSTGSLC